jgi:Mg2+ and Co2+ transporter CorA
MKTITLLCAILWALTSIFNLYGITFGDYAIPALFSESPMYAFETIAWFLADCATSLFFFVLWTKQN